MQIEGVWAYLVVEALFITVLCVLIMFSLYLRERKRATRHPEATRETASVANPYRVALQQQVHETEARLEQLKGSDGMSASEHAAMTVRLQYLRAEQAADGAGESFWPRLAEQLGTLLNSVNPPPQAADEGQERMLRALRKRIQAFESRVANLEQFKTYFFELKQQYAETVHLGRDIQNAVDKAVPASEQPPELKEALRQLQDENTRLELQLSQVEQEFDNIMRNVRALSTSSASAGTDTKLDGAADALEHGMQQVKRVIGTQEQQIRELQSIIAGLEMELEEKNKLQKMLDEINDKSTQLSSVVEILEEENTFLQQQISALLSQELEEDKNKTRRVEEVEARLADYQRLLAELETRYATLEGEFRAASEELQQLKQ